MSSKKKTRQQKRLDAIRSDNEDADDERKTKPNSDSDRILFLEKQITSMAESMKTLLERLPQPQTNAGHSGIVLIPSRTSSPPSFHSSSSVMSAEQLMFQTAKLNLNQSTLEKNMKKWEDPTQKGWIKFKDLWIEYSNNGGHNSLYDLCSN